MCGASSPIRSATESIAVGGFKGASAGSGAECTTGARLGVTGGPASSKAEASGFSGAGAGSATGTDSGAGEGVGSTDGGGWTPSHA